MQTVMGIVKNHSILIVRSGLKYVQEGMVVKERIVGTPIQMVARSHQEYIKYVTMTHAIIHFAIGSTLSTKLQWNTNVNIKTARKYGMKCPNKDSKRSKY